VVIMRNKQIDDWVSENMVLNDADKRHCVGIVHTIMSIAIDVRNNGLLSIESKIPQFHDMFLRKK